MSKKATGTDTAGEKETTGAAPPRAKRGVMTWVLMGVVGLVSAGAGFAVPLFLKEPAAPSHEAPHDGEPSKSDLGEPGLASVPFGDVVANLDDNRMMRYLRVKFSLSAEKKDAPTLLLRVEENKTSLKNWLIGYLQNKQIEEVRGTEGFNHIRRDILEQFNQMLYPKGDEIIKEVLFEEFNVQ